MRDITNLKNFLLQEKNNLDAHGHCRIDYTDPLTGKVLERVEGDNHVFVDQFVNNFQSTALRSTLLLTDGKSDLDTDFPWIPGNPIGYGNIDSSATGIYLGSYRSVDSYISRITQQGVTSLYVYDFLTPQIPDAIGYVGLTAQSRQGCPSLPFSYSWPSTDATGIYDIERKKLYGWETDLNPSRDYPKKLLYTELFNEPLQAVVKHDVLELCDNPSYILPLDGDYSSQYTYDTQYHWIYDYENEQMGFWLFRGVWEYRYDTDEKKYKYTLKMQHDVWVFSKDGSAVDKHFTKTWRPVENADAAENMYKYYLFPYTGSHFPSEGRLYGEKIYFFSDYSPDHSVSNSSTEYYVYTCDISTGEITYTKYAVDTVGTHYLMGGANTLYCYKGYTFGQACYIDSSGCYYGFDATKMGENPVFDVYNEKVYASTPVCMDRYSISSYLIEKGQTSIYSKTWNLKGAGYMPFAFTAYQLPKDAPVRPKNSAVTIAYGLEINW